MRKILTLGFLTRFRLKFVFLIGISDFVPPPLKGEGVRGRGSIARNLPTIATRIQPHSMRKVFVGAAETCPHPALRATFPRSGGRAKL